MTQRYPLPITNAMLAKANPHEGKPRYDTAGAADWHDPIEDVALLTTGPALVAADDGVYTERGPLVVVKRTEALKVFTGFFQLYALTDEIDDVDPSSDFFDFVSQLPGLP